MKKNVFYMTLILLMICIDSYKAFGSDNRNILKAPETSASNTRGWEIYVDPIILNLETIDRMVVETDFPEAPLVKFYASMIRGDMDFEKGLPLDQKKYDLKRTIEKLLKWKFIEVRLLKRKKLSTDKYWIKLFMKIEIKGKTDSGTDEASVKKIDGRWYLTNPPT